MRILIFVLLLLGTSLKAQNVLTCYDYHDFSETDCVGCGLKDSTFSGILLVKNGTIYQPLVKPIKIKTRPNILDMEDGFATRVSIYIDQITTYNTEASVLAFLRACACGVTVDSTMITEGWGINVTEPTANNYVIEADSSQVATTYDLTLKQDLLNGVAPRIPYFTSPTTLGTNSNFWWDNTYNEMVIKDRLFGSSATGQLYVGYLAGDAATSAIHSNFLSDGAGSQATNSKHSNFFGYRAGRFATNAPYSFFVGDSTGMSATNAKHSTFIGLKSGYGATNAQYSTFIGDSTGYTASNAEHSFFAGLKAGYGAFNGYNSIFLGRDAGSNAINAFSTIFLGAKSGSASAGNYRSVFIGRESGYLSSGNDNSNFMGDQSGWNSFNSPYSNWFGHNAGYGASASPYSNFFGDGAGSSQAEHSNFFGNGAGNGSYSSNSNFLGYRSGYGQFDSDYSTFIGRSTGEHSLGRALKMNNIIIGTGITLPDSSENSMTLGNVLYGTGFKFNLYSSDSSQYVSAQGKIGVLTSSPTQQLHVAGNLRVEGAIYDSNNEPGTSGQVLSTTVTGTDWVDMAGGDTTQYLNPYIMGPDTVGFYLTIAQDTVLFVATADTTAGTVDIVTGTSPIIITGDATHTPNVTIQNATTSQSGALTSTDWNTFNSKVGGSGTSTRVAFWSGASTLSSNANLYWDNTNNRLGIGTASPLMKLDVSGDVSITGGSALYSFGTGNAGSTDARWGNFYNSGSETRFLTSGKGTYSSAVPDMYFSKFNGSNVTDMMFIKSSNGNVGIGTITPNTNLELKGSSFTGGLPTDNSFTTGSALTLNNNTGSGTIASINYSTIPTFELVPDVTKPANGLRMGTFNVLGTGDMFFQLAATSSTGYSYFEAFGGEGLVLGTGEAKPIHFRPNRNTAMTILSGGNVGIGNISPQRKLHVTGEVRITDLTTDTPTGLVGADADGDLGSVGLSGLSMVSGTLTNSFNGDITAVTVTAPLTGGGTSGSISVGLDTTSATGVATQYDLTQVAGSSKVIDILGSDYTTSATSLQSTALTYTFPSTGTYEIKVYGSYTCSNTANGINVGFIDSGGLVASYITGKHSAFTNNGSSSSQEFRKPISSIGTTLSTGSVNASSTPYTVVSEALITVSTAGTITLGFASGSGSYSATLQAGSSLLIEKLN